MFVRGSDTKLFLMVGKKGEIRNVEFLFHYYASPISFDYSFTLSYCEIDGPAIIDRYALTDHL